MIWRKICMAALCAAVVSVEAEENRVDLATAAQVQYTYLDANGNELGDKEFNDDGKTLTYNGDAKVVSTKYLDNVRKVISVRFNFPVEISPTAIRFNWMWAHNERQWLDRVDVYTGNEPKTLTKVTTFVNPKRIKYNRVPLEFSLPSGRGRMVRLDFTQDAAPGHFMMGINGVQIFGTNAERQRIANPDGKFTLEIKRHTPCNLFEAGKAVELPITLTTPENSRSELVATVHNYFGDIVEQQNLQAASRTEKTVVPLKIEGLAPGYYEVDVAAKLYVGDRIQKTSGKASFSVATFRPHSAQATLAAGNRFGIQGGFSSPEGYDAFLLLGLNWLRELPQFGPWYEKNPQQPFEQADNYVKNTMVNRSFVNMFEIKTFPRNCYDTQRYGAMQGNKWVAGSVPVKDKYQQYLTALLNRIPAEGRYFEIWNEPWDMDPADFATIAQMTEEAIHKARPNAIVGPNLGPLTNLVQVIKAGGLDHMDMVTIHPYAADFKSSPEKAEIRNWVRAFKTTLREHLKRDLPLYVTEIGWPTTPKGPMANTEREQAQYLVRAGLELYAEDVKAIMPYCMGQPETDPTEKEHYFGFLRKNQEPKPVLPAYATLAKMIDGTQYLGDIWLGTDVGAMLFQRDDVNILVLYTPQKEHRILLRPHATKVKIVNIMGESTDVEVKNQRLPLTLTGDPIYVVGVGNELRATASKTPQTQWSDVYRRATRKAVHFSTPPVMDGSFTAWEKVPEIKIADSSVPAKDASAGLKVGWDNNYLYLALRVTDNEPGINNQQGDRVWDGDCFELFFSPLPDRAIPGFLKENDYQLLITPFSKSGEPVIVFGDNYRRGQVPKGVKTFFKKRADGWDAEIALPLSVFPGAVAAKGNHWSLEGSLDDADTAHTRIQISSNGRKDNHSNSSVWSLLELE